jgi:hypothetical protein
MSDTDVRPRRIEYCCDRCLASIYAPDDGPIPRCARCDIKMEPDDPDVPPARKAALRAARRQRVTGKHRGEMTRKPAADRGLE